jgi:ABC-type multidrug transport system permease subunit
MAPFFARGGSGYLVDLDLENFKDARQCSYCAYKTGDEFFVNDLSFKYEHRWRDAAILGAFIGSNLLVLVLGSWRLNWNRR